MNSLLCLSVCFIFYFFRLPPPRLVSYMRVEVFFVSIHFLVIKKFVIVVVVFVSKRKNQLVNYRPQLFKERIKLMYIGWSTTSTG